MILCDRPLIAQFDSGLRITDIDGLLSIHDYQASQGFNHIDQSSAQVKERTSFSYFDVNDDLRPYRELMLDRIQQELDITHTVDSAEFLQLTKYQQGQEYVAHYDHFNLPGYENTVTVDRVATALLYLNDGFEGGETYFPSLNITVYPRQGDILYFAYPPEVARDCLHAGLPVRRGEKRIASLWIRAAQWPVQG